MEELVILAVNPVGPAPQAGAYFPPDIRPPLPGEMAPRVLDFHIEDVDWIFVPAERERRRRRPQEMGLMEVARYRAPLVLITIAYSVLVFGTIIAFVSNTFGLETVLFFYSCLAGFILTYLLAELFEMDVRSLREHMVLCESVFWVYVLPLSVWHFWYYGERSRFWNALEGEAGVEFEGIFRRMFEWMYEWMFEYKIWVFI
ncbi:hypothetical protein TWF506_003568 [Arthrobotrys conoides]|uniref:Uncharacterized protein n=1 Tax=Arthrobotrys conoides TaxID=74498 RepID=A0AAN8P5E1_9PEZI